MIRIRRVPRHRLSCSLSSLALAGCLFTACAPPPPEHLVLISLDTTRKDHLQTYGYPRETSPHLDRLARRSVVFHNATAQMTITNPSHASIFTGLYPHTHRVGENTRRLDDRFVTLTEVLRDAGFRTGGFVSGHPLRAEITGIDQGFEVYDSDFRRRRAGRLTTDRALEWLREQEPGERGERGERIFLFLHLYDAHGPYLPEEPYRALFRSREPGPELAFIPSYQQLRDEEGRLVRDLHEYVDRYDALIRTQDDLVAEVLEAVDLERTAVVVVADHGETLADRATPLNLNHGTSVFEEQTAIPLILHAPGLAAGEVRQPVETVDLLPTLLPLLGVAAPEELEPEGRNLLPWMTGDGAPRERTLAYAVNRAFDRHHEDRGYRLREGDFIRSVRSLRFKLIRYPGVDGDYFELFDLRRDPGERVNLASRHPELLDSLGTALDRWQGAVPGEEGPATDLSPEDVEQLRALGYL